MMNKEQLEHFEKLFEEAWGKYLVKLNEALPPSELSALIEAGFIRSNKMAYKSGFLTAIEIALKW